MSIFCISDLHCGDKGSRDNFAFDGREDRFYRFLDYVGDNQLIIAGDLIDAWQVNLSKAVVTYEKLLDRLDAMQARYIIGNHDVALAYFIGTSMMMGHPFFKRMCHPFEETIGDRRFAFLHGSEGDPYCKATNPGTGEITAIIAGMLEDRAKSPVDHRGNAVEDIFVGSLENALTLWRRLTFQHDRVGEMLDGVEAYRKEVGADVVISGHTHLQGRIQDHYFNCGCWCRSSDGFTRIEDDGTVSMWTWCGDRAEPFDKELR
jgi:UDP-2,3-diacylglucosamine pyrophosphatase LpxH